MGGHTDAADDSVGDPLVVVLQWVDADGQPRFAQMPLEPEAIAFIDDAVEAKGKVLVHCMVGASRSVSLVLAWLVARCKLPLKQAFQLVRSKRHQARPNRSFCEQLMAFEEEQLGKRSATLADFFHK